METTPIIRWRYPVWFVGGCPDYSHERWLKDTLRALRVAAQYLYIQRQCALSGQPSRVLSMSGLDI